MTKHIPIKVMTRLSDNQVKYHLKNILKLCKVDNFIVIDNNPISRKYCEDQQIQFTDGINNVYSVQWINKHDTSLDKTFNNQSDKLESLSIR